MPRPQKLPAPSAALRNARRAWRLLHQDAPASLDLAQRALARSLQTGDVPAQAWARLALGFHHLYFASPDEASEQLTLARGAFDDLSDRVGQLLACVGQARALWRSGQADEALALLLPLRDEGLRLLRHEQRGVLLNAIAGCYSAQGRSEEAFAYLYEALRGAGPARGHGFDAALHCNLSHELMELGDHDQALEQIQQGLARCEGLCNVRLESVLRINRVIVLTELGLADQALADVHRLSALSTGAAGRGTRSLHFETLAIAALRAGQAELGADLVARARALESTLLSEERVELAMASALLAWRQGDAADALERLAVVSPLLAGPGGAHGVGLRICAAVEMLASELHEARGDSAAALAALRRWQAARRGVHAAPRVHATRRRRCRPNCSSCGTSWRKTTSSARPPSARGPRWRWPIVPCRARSSRSKRCRPRCATRPARTYSPGCTTGATSTTPCLPNLHWRCASASRWRWP